MCIAQNGPGITNFVTGVAAAFWAHRSGLVLEMIFLSKIEKYQSSKVYTTTLQPSGCDHSRDRQPGHRVGRLPRDEPASHIFRDHQIPGACYLPQKVTSAQMQYSALVHSCLPNFFGIFHIIQVNLQLSRMAEFTNRCFNYAQMERGPVQLNIPRDMFYGDVQVSLSFLLNLHPNPLAF